jgi:hypothetical protein
MKIKLIIYNNIKIISEYRMNPKGISIKAMISLMMKVLLKIELLRNKN